MPHILTTDEPDPLLGHCYECGRAIPVEHTVCAACRGLELAGPSDRSAAKEFRDAAPPTQKDRTNVSTARAASIARRWFRSGNGQE